MNNELLEELKAMGIELEFDDGATEDQKAEIISDFMNATGPPSFTSEEPCSLAAMLELAKDIAPNAEQIAADLTALANRPETAAEDDQPFEKTGLFELYALLEQQSLALNIDHHDPIEIGGLLNPILTAFGKPVLAADLLQSIEDGMEEADDDVDHVWSSFFKELSERGVTLVEVSPVGGTWSVDCVVMMPIDKLSSWENRAFGDYGLLHFFG